MKITGYATTLALWLAAVGAAPLWGQETPKAEGRKIVATSTVTVSVPPDAARLSFFVATTEGTEKSIREANDSHVKRVKDAVAGLPVEQSTIELHTLPASFSTNVPAGQNPMAVRVPQSKKAQTIVQVIVRDQNLDKLRSTVARIAETATDLGATGVEPENPLRTIRLARPLGGAAEETEPVPRPSIEWLSSGGGAARRAALRKAFEDALADAQAIAGDAKLTVAEIQVTPEDSPLLRLTSRNETVPQNALISIKVQVRVTCSY
jgi:uncharacterized protein YggE